MSLHEKSNYLSLPPFLQRINKLRVTKIEQKMTELAQARDEHDENHEDDVGTSTPSIFQSENQSAPDSANRSATASIFDVEDSVGVRDQTYFFNYSSGTDDESLHHELLSPALTVVIYPLWMMTFLSGCYNCISTLLLNGRCGFRLC